MVSLAVLLEQAEQAKIQNGFKKLTASKIRLQRQVRFPDCHVCDGVVELKDAIVAHQEDGRCGVAEAGAGLPQVGAVGRVHDQISG